MPHPFFIHAVFDYFLDLREGMQQREAALGVIGDDPYMARFATESHQGHVADSHGCLGHRRPQVRHKGRAQPLPQRFPAVSGNVAAGPANGFQGHNDQSGAIQSLFRPPLMPESDIKIPTGGVYEGLTLGITQGFAYRPHDGGCDGACKSVPLARGMNGSPRKLF